MARTRPPHGTDSLARRHAPAAVSSPLGSGARGRRVRLPLALLAAGGSLLCANLLTGCVAVPNVGPRPMPIAAERLETSQTLASTGAAWPEDRWWLRFNDPQLTGLINEALVGSPDLAAADARLRRAAGSAQAAGAALAPSITANGQAAMVRQSYNNGIPAQFVPQGWNDTGRISLDLSWELDFFGRNRAALRAATSTEEAARVEAQAARITLAAAITDAYADFAAIVAEKAAAQDGLRVRTDSARLVAQRVAAGLENTGEQRQSEAALANARATLAGIEEAEAQTRNRIAALVGAGPDRGLALTAPPRVPSMGQGLPDNLALNLIGRRADIVAARLRAEAAGSQIDVARADFYPNVNLTAFLGLQSLGLSNLIESGSRIGSVGPAISLPIFDAGRIQGNYRVSRASYDEAVANYDATLIRALREVADAVATRRAVDQRLVDTRAALQAASDAHRIARNRYQGGLTTYLVVLTAEDALIANRRSLAELEARSLNADVALMRALGGGFAA